VDLWVQLDASGQILGGRHQPSQRENHATAQPPEIKPTHRRQGRAILPSRQTVAVSAWACTPRGRGSHLTTQGTLGRPRQFCLSQVFVETVRHLRLGLGLTQQEIAEQTSVSVSYISKVENEKFHFGDYLP
jgi:DNA-binding XRE family transcriptional regulator